MTSQFLKKNKKITQFIYRQIIVFVRFYTDADPGNV